MRLRATTHAFLLVTVAAAPVARAEADPERGTAEEISASSDEPSGVDHVAEEYPVDVVFSRRHVSFGMGGGPIVFGSIVDDGHFVGSHVGGLVNLGVGNHVDLRGGVYAGPSGSARGLLLPLGIDIEVRFGDTTRPFSAGVAIGLGYLVAPERSVLDRWMPTDGFYLRPQLIPMALQLDRFEIALAVGLDLVEQRRLERGRFGPAFVSTGLRFYLVGYESQDVVPK